ncbi:MAG: chromosomal replication initiator protein DnaA [Treponema sp.]|nr:chromosomal replication initiator protein DnaA [Candidatus Treponema equifaecale]
MAGQNYKEFFEEAMNQIHQEFTNSGREDDFKLWFNLQYVEDTISEITVSVPSEFMWKQMVSKGNVQIVQNKINELLGQNIQLNHIVNSKPAEAPAFVQPVQTTAATISEEKKEEPKSHPQSESNSPKSNSKHPQLNEEFTFDTFIPGDNSQYAYSACIAAAQAPGSKNYNPILLYGSSGVGKTHLMVSIGNYIFQNNPSLKIGYITTESFMNEFTQAIREKTTDKFSKKYRKLDVILLDDLQFMEGKEALQNELFYTFEDIYNRKGQIVFTCDRPISEIKGIAERLRTRFTRGLSIDLKAPDYETRLAILDKKLELQGKSIKQEVKEFIAKNIQSNVRELEGALSKGIGYAELMHKELTLDIIQELLGDYVSSGSSGIINIDVIQKVVCDYYNVSIADIKSSKREKRIAVPRHIAIYLGRKLTEYSLTDLGEEFGGRDHTTVMSSLKKIEDLLKTDSSMGDTIKILERQIKES